MVVADQTSNLLSDLTLGELFLYIGLIAGGLGTVWKLWPLVRKLTLLTDDWHGQPARPGVKSRKGVMERLSDQDEAIAELKSNQRGFREDLEPFVEAARSGNVLGATNQDIVDRLDTLAQESRSTAAHGRKVERLLFRHMRESRAWITAVDEGVRDTGYKVPPWPNLPDPEEIDGEDGGDATV